MAQNNQADVGAKAPDFTLKNQHGEPVQLSNLLKNGPVVLYFYPKDDTPGCTLEACAFRDEYEVFTDLGASVVGVSSDSVESHKAFAARYKLPFTLVSDQDGRVRELYNVSKTLWLLPGRVTFVIGSDGVIHHRFDSQIRARQHVPESIATIRRLKSQRA